MRSFASSRATRSSSPAVRRSSICSTSCRSFSDTSMRVSSEYALPTWSPLPLGEGILRRRVAAGNNADPPDHRPQRRRRREVGGARLASVIRVRDVVALVEPLLELGGVHVAVDRPALRLVAVEA